MEVHVFVKLSLFMQTILIVWPTHHSTVFRTVITIYITVVNPFIYISHTQISSPQTPWKWTLCGNRDSLGLKTFSTI